MYCGWYQSEAAESNVHVIELDGPLLHQSEGIVDTLFPALNEGLYGNA